MAIRTCPTFLNLPAELRNAIYLLVFDSEASSRHLPPYNEPPSVLATALRISQAHPNQPNKPSNQLQCLLSCRQMHSEAHLLALSLTRFHLHGDCTYPDLFDLRTRSLSPPKISSIRHISLTTRIMSLKALNEAWAGLPFGHPSLKLESLTIVPKRPDASNSAYAEVADLSQSHTLAYVLAETLKCLRNVGVVEIVNAGCFNEVVWRLVYRSLVYRLWRWGGGCCGIRFLSSEAAKGDGKAHERGASGEEWFKVFLDGNEGSEAGEELRRLVGGSGGNPDEDGTGAGP